MRAAYVQAGVETSIRATKRKVNLSLPNMGCVTYDQILLEWKWLVYHDPGLSSGEDTLTVEVFWRLVEHQMKCPLCKVAAERMPCFSIVTSRPPST